jgi:hypothetical protein
MTENIQGFTFGFAHVPLGDFAQCFVCVFTCILFNYALNKDASFNVFMTVHNESERMRKEELME